MEAGVEKEGVFVVSVIGKIDAMTVPIFEIMSKEFLEQEKAKVLFDLKDLEYISSEGLTALVDLIKATDKEKTLIAFCSLQGVVADTFESSGYASDLAIYGKRNQALMALCAKELEELDAKTKAKKEKEKEEEEEKKAAKARAKAEADAKAKAALGIVDDTKALPPGTEDNDEIPDFD